MQIPQDTVPASSLRAAFSRRAECFTSISLNPQVVNRAWKRKLPDRECSLPGGERKPGNLSAARPESIITQIQGSGARPFCAA